MECSRNSSNAAKIQIMQLQFNRYSSNAAAIQVMQPQRIILNSKD
jgi:hypothetical protein